MVLTFRKAILRQSKRQNTSRTGRRDDPINLATSNASQWPKKIEVSMLMRSILLASVLSPALMLVAGDVYTPLISKLQESSQQGRHIGIFCDYKSSQAEVRAFVDQLSDGSLVTVVDLRDDSKLGAAYTAMNRMSPDFMVLLDRDRVVAPGKAAATYLIGHMNLQNKPTLAITRLALEQGAFAALGADTGFEWVVNPSVPAGTVTLEGAKATMGRGVGGAQMNVINLE